MRLVKQYGHYYRMCFYDKYDNLLVADTGQGVMVISITEEGEELLVCSVLANKTRITRYSPPTFTWNICLRNSNTIIYYPTRTNES